MNIIPLKLLIDRQNRTMRANGQINFFEQPDHLKEVCMGISPVSLDEMDRVKLLDRFDKKFVLRVTRLPEILKAAAKYYSILMIDEHRIFDYRTQYYDTPEFRMYLNHHNRKLNRYKVRKREYVTTGEVFFEIKFKSNKGRTRKKRILIDRPDNRLRKEEKKFLKKNSPYTRKDLEPKVMNLFSRITLVNKTSAERVTIDMDLKYQINGSDVNLPALAIIEIKQGRSSGISDLERILRDRKITPFKISKYCIGSVMLNKDLKYNRFKNKIITLNKLTDDSRVASVFVGP
jgi:hypothetical protein